MPVVIATLWPKDERRDEVASILYECIPAVHMEDGCELYALHEADDRLVIVESWTSDEQLEAHRDGEVLADLDARLDSLMQRPADIVIAEPVVAGEPDKGVLAGA